MLLPVVTTLYCFFFTGAATTEIYTLSLHDALPICSNRIRFTGQVPAGSRIRLRQKIKAVDPVEGGVRITSENTVEVEGASRPARSEEHTSELQSRGHLVCRLLLEKKKNTTQSVTQL